MLRTRFCQLLRSLFIGFALLLSASAAWAQGAPIAPHGYDFLTITSFDNANKLLFAPTFQGKSEVQLESFNGMLTDKNIAKLQHNTAIINQQLSDLTVAGWELVQVYVTPNGPLAVTTRYLFRKPKP